MRLPDANTPLTTSLRRAFNKTTIGFGLLGGFFVGSLLIALTSGISPIGRPSVCDSQFANPNIDHDYFADRADPRWTPPLEAGDNFKVEIAACGNTSNSSSCTAALLANDKQTGELFAITAAHCLNDDEISTVAGNAAHAGTDEIVATFQKAPWELDVGRLLLTDQTTSPTNTINIGGTTAEVTGLLADVATHQGLAMCHAGISSMSYLDRTIDLTTNTGPTCGTGYIDGDNFCFDAIGSGGDSGAVVFHSDAQGTVQAVGVVSNAVHETHWWSQNRLLVKDYERPARICYVPIGAAMDHLNLTFGYG